METKKGENRMPLTGKDMVKLLKKNGWTLDRIEGSHHYMVKKGFSPIPVPVHSNKDLKKGLEQFILKRAGLK